MKSHDTIHITAHRIINYVCMSCGLSLFWISYFLQSAEDFSNVDYVCKWKLFILSVDCCWLCHDKK